MPCCARSVIRSLVTGAISFGGNVGQSTTAGDGIRAYIGRAAELWAADGFGFFAVINALFHEAGMPQKHSTTKTISLGRNNMAC
jgi:hypothetical protein